MCVRAHTRVCNSSRCQCTIGMVVRQVVMEVLYLDNDGETFSPSCSNIVKFTLLQYTSSLSLNTELL